MTRSTHLLCMTVSRRTLGEGEEFDANCVQLRGQGYHYICKASYLLQKFALTYVPTAKFLRPDRK